MKNNFARTHKDDNPDSTGTAFVCGYAPIPEDVEFLDRVAHNKEFWKRFFATDRSIRRSEADWAYAIQLANQWDTCACGSINDGLPREGTGWQPSDHKLYHLGNQFPIILGKRDLTRARRHFMAINRRAAEVLEEMGLAGRKEAGNV